FLAQAPFEIASADDYERTLTEAGRVIVDVAERRERIRRGAIALGEAAGGAVEIDETLLAEVTHLVEYPTPILGAFDRSYLAIPAEILVTTMREHQKYFPVRAPDGTLLPHFVAVRNG